MDNKILKLIKSDETMNSVLMSIVNIGDLFETTPEVFNNLNSALDTITTILKNNGIDQRNTGNRLTNNVCENITILEFYNGSCEEYYINIILCRFLIDLGDKLYRKFGVSIVSCTFSIDSSSIFVIGGRQNKDIVEDDDCYEDIYIIENFILKEVHPNGPNGGIVYY